MPDFKIDGIFKLAKCVFQETLRDTTKYSLWLCLKSLRTSSVYREPRSGSSYSVKISKWLLQSHVTIPKKRNWNDQFLKKNTFWNDEGQFLAMRLETFGILADGTADFWHLLTCKSSEKFWSIPRNATLMSINARPSRWLHQSLVSYTFNNINILI